jgi:hypothetical protein
VEILGLALQILRILIIKMEILQVAQISMSYWRNSQISGLIHKLSSLRVLVGLERH